MIASDITQTDGIKVGLLIGANCMKALEPMKMISSVDGSPYAYRRRLGWCIVGPNINMVGKKSIGCNRVAVIDATSSNISSYHFVVKEAMKEVRLEEMFQTMYKNDFNEASTVKPNSRTKKDAREVSSKDRRFIKLVEEKAGEHYVAPLPFWKESLEKPNNRRQAMKRLIYLKARFKRKPPYFVDYKKFMDDLVAKGYARKEDKRTHEKTWFIPHHGMYHPSKPGKIRVVLDCSAEFDEQSLQKELLTGHDLTNKIVGVLTRFQQISTGFMADIETTYYR